MAHSLLLLCLAALAASCSGLTTAAAGAPAPRLHRAAPTRMQFWSDGKVGTALVHTRLCLHRAQRQSLVHTLSLPVPTLCSL